MGERKQRFNKPDMARDIDFRSCGIKTMVGHFELENILERHKVWNKTLVCELYRVKTKGNRDNQIFLVWSS